MVRTCNRTISKFIESAERYAHVGDVGEPINPELEQLLLIDNLCRRYGVLPSELLEEDANVLRIAKISNYLDNLRANNGK